MPARRLLLCLLVCSALAACGGGAPVDTSPDVGSVDTPDASCAYPCGKKCCTKSQTCNFATETCQDQCVPDCNGRSCGDNGCGVQCGYCDPGTVCNEGAGKCVACTANCANKQCGSDGCGGSCGGCDPGFACNASFQCAPVPAADAGAARPDASQPAGPDSGSVSPGADASQGAADVGPSAADVGSSPADVGTPGLNATSAGPDAAAPGLDAATVRPDAGTPSVDAGPSAICEPQAPQYNPSFTASQFCEMWGRVICDRLSQCCLLSTATYQDCVDYKARECNTADVTARIVAGTVTVDMTVAHACFDAERARTACDGNAYVMLAPACGLDRVIKGNAVPGAACLLATDCVGGVCARTQGTCDGTCQGYQALSGTCDTTNLCDPAEGLCKGGVCVAWSATGTACGSGCLPTDFCSGGMCTTRHGPGESCVDSSNCLSILSCIGGTCRDDYSVPANGACKASSNCAAGTFCVGATSTTTGTCTPYLGVGTTCTVAGGIECGPDEYCASGTLVCMARVGMYGSCSSSGQCQSGLTCYGTQCIPQGELGDYCTSDSQCRRYLRCSGFSCTDSLAGAGASCSQTPECDQGYCPSSTNTCTTYIADLQPCTSDVSCASGDCEATVCRPNCTY